MRKCPGFETDIHGLVEIEGEDGKTHYYADCVATPEPETAVVPGRVIQVGNKGPFRRTI